MLVERAMRPSADGSTNLGLGFLAFAACKMTMITAATLLTFYNPPTSLSGIAKLKSFLNGRPRRVWRQRVSSATSADLPPVLTSQPPTFEPCLRPSNPLTGTHVGKQFLSLQTCIAKTVGITLVVASGLPLGREGPMVHIGAMVSALLSRWHT